MILEKDQIHRYMRHIIMPEISGTGQKKLLDSSVLVCCEDIEHSSFMLYYLTAMGLGKITLDTGTASDTRQLFNGLKRLNPDVQLFFNNSSSVNNDYDAVIVFNPSNKITSYASKSKDTAYVFAAVSGDEGFLQTVIQLDSLESVITEHKNFSQAARETTLFNYPCSSLIGVLAAVETVKAVLQIGSLCEKPLYVDLWDYSFANEIFDLPQKSSISILQDFSDMLRNAKVLIVGSGGLGSPVAYILAQMGIGRLGLVDFDTVDISNLNRQILHSTDKIGMAKVESAKAFLKELSPDMEICTYRQKFSAENAESLVKDYDIIVDGLDNLPTRYLLNDICFFLKKPLVEAGVLAFNGLATAIIPDKGPCYRCTFPEVADTAAIPSCSETGVLGAVPGILGSLQAAEVIKQLTGQGDSLLNKIIMYDALNAEFTKLDIYKEEACPLCGNNPTIDALKDYNFVCSSKNET